MHKELRYSFQKLNKAFNKLKEGVVEAGQVNGELARDGVIQRFEFTFELLWKTLKIFLREKGIEVKTPKDSLKEAFRIGWIKDEGIFAQMLEDRNNTSHMYAEEKVKEIFDRIKANYVASLEKILIALEKEVPGLD